MNNKKEEEKKMSFGRGIAKVVLGSVATTVLAPITVAVPALGVPLEIVSTATVASGVSDITNSK